MALLASASLALRALVVALRAVAQVEVPFRAADRMKADDQAAVGLKLSATPFMQ